MDRPQSVMCQLINDYPNWLHSIWTSVILDNPKE